MLSQAGLCQKAFHCVFSLCEDGVFSCSRQGTEPQSQPLPVNTQQEISWASPLNGLNSPASPQGRELSEVLASGRAPGLGQGCAGGNKEL